MFKAPSWQVFRYPGSAKQSSKLRISGLSVSLIQSVQFTHFSTSMQKPTLSVALTCKAWNGGANWRAGMPWTSTTCCNHRTLPFTLLFWCGGRLQSNLPGCKEMFCITRSVEVMSSNGNSYLKQRLP